MENSDHASFDIENLENSLREELESLRDSPSERCIYRVPKRLRCLNEGAYTPQVVSIGPLHHGAKELIAMEEHKKKYLNVFLGRTQVSLKDFIKCVKDKEARLPNFYAEAIELGSCDFVKMILVDAIFVIEILLRFYDRTYRIVDDGIFTHPWMIYDITSDMWLLENQIPLFIFEELLELGKTTLRGKDYGLTLPSIINLTSALIESDCSDLLIDKNSVETQFSEAKHFVDLLILCLQPSKIRSVEPKNQNESAYIPSSTELHQAGVKFKVGSSKKLLDITFGNGSLEIPLLKVGGGTESLFRNLLAYEQVGHLQRRYFTNYVIFINYLVNTSKDVDLLVDFGVIYNRGLANEQLSAIFHNIVKDIIVDVHDLNYSHLVQGLNAYCRKPWHKWKANLKQNYFNTPWTSISVIAAIILLVLTLIQTVFSAT